MKVTYHDLIFLKSLEKRIGEVDIGRRFWDRFDYNSNELHYIT